LDNLRIKYLTSNPNIQNNIQNFILEWNNPLPYIQTQTSGSTGKPKIIHPLKKHLIASAKMTGAFFGFSSSNSILLAMSLDTIAGKMILIRALVYNMEVVVVDIERNPIKSLNTPIYFASFASFQIKTMLKENPDKLDWIKNILIGGAPISKTISTKIELRKSNYYESFGMTETLSHIALKDLSNKKEYFEVLPNISIYHTNNCLSISAPDLGVNNLTTTDVVEIIDSNHFKWIGRNDFCINSGGVKIHPEILENKIEDFIKAPFFIHKEQNDDFGEIVILVIEKKDDDKNQIFETLKNVLSNYERPKKIYFSEKFIRTNSGKIIRNSTFERIKK
jgi:O-succinylbenzoic acid--CoA ligase